MNVGEPGELGGECDFESWVWELESVEEETGS